ncbi:unnamed protein product [Euphydryas editha]|uniref:Peptidase S1 domain-containing protein n=1 Tax=Euphydryas editha TaxID=104508 RepID=A0AAU9V136_EUPED|nr:unnamed protein product [Euphydryas editha]
MSELEFLNFCKANRTGINTSVPVQQLKIVVGENYSDRGTLLLTVILVVVHQDFNPFTLVADLAMIRFYEDVTFKSSIKSISLITPNLPLSNSTAFVAGWGRCDLMGKELCLPRSSVMFPDELIDPMLRAVSFTINSPNFYCDGYKKHGTGVRSGMLCAGSAREENPTYPCLAVPGAPLTVNAKLVGVLSWGFGCGYLHDLPLVYTSVQHYTMWIAHNIKIFRKLSTEHVNRLFEATKSILILEWLDKTRVIKPTRHDHGNNYKDLHPLELDQRLSQLEGNIYDVRDFIKEKDLNLKKKLMYEVIQKAQNKSRKYKKKKLENSIILQKLRVYPFLNKSSLRISSFDSADEIYNDDMMMI